MIWEAIKKGNKYVSFFYEVFNVIKAIKQF